MTQASSVGVESSSSSLIVPDSAAAKFDRGFKTRAENLAASYREALGLRRVAPLPPRELANHLGVIVITPSDLSDLPLDSLEYLLSEEGNEWSAAAVKACGLDLIVINTTHNPLRQANDIMHELSHIILMHEPVQVVISAESGVGLRGFNVKQEAEANWLAASLLLPRESLVYCLKQKMDKTEISAHHGVSEELVRYRINVTGASRQYKN